MVLLHIDWFLKCLQMIRALDIYSVSPSSVPNSAMVIFQQEKKFFQLIVFSL
jgi:hypothetical protein